MLWQYTLRSSKFIGTDFPHFGRWERQRWELGKSYQKLKMIDGRVKCGGMPNWNAIKWYVYENWIFKFLIVQFQHINRSKNDSYFSNASIIDKYRSQLLLIRLKRNEFYALIYHIFDININVTVISLSLSFKMMDKQNNCWLINGNEIINYWHIFHGFLE